MATMLPDGRRLGAHLPLGTGMVKRGRAGDGDRGERDPDLRRQPDRLAAPRGTAARAGGLPRSAPRARHPTGRDPRRLPGQPGRARRRLLRAVGRGAGQRAARRAAASRRSFVNVHTGSHRGTGAAARDGAASPTGVAAASWPRPTASRMRAVLVLENSAGGGFGIGTTVEELADIADGDRGGAASPDDRVGVLPRHRPCLGRRLPTLRSRRRSTNSSTAFDAPDRDRPAGDGPPQRLEVRARLAHRSPRARRGGPDRRGRAWRTSCATRCSPARRTILETPGMDEGYDAINVARALALAAGRPLEPLPPGAMTLRGSRARSAPEPAPSVEPPSPTRTRRRSSARARPPPRVDRRADARRASCSRVVVLAAVLRFVNLPTRGTWDADQGHDMLVLRGARPGRASSRCSGPPTSIGDFHHGVLYYYLLAPAAALSGADPLGVVGCDRAGRRRRGRGHVVAGTGDRRARRRRRRGAAHGRVGERGRRVDVHLEPEPHRALELDRARRRLAGVDRRPGALVGGRRRSASS